MAHDLGADLHEFFPEVGQRPLLDRLGQRQRPREVGEIVGLRNSVLHLGNADLQRAGAHARRLGNRVQRGLWRGGKRIAGDLKNVFTVVLRVRRRPIQSVVTIAAPSEVVRGQK